MTDKPSAAASHTAAQAKYDKANTTGFYMKLNTRTDQDILEWLEKQSSKQGAIKELIREKIRHEKG